jgi:branched-chain amino acid transport system substrate-binding protein
VKTRHQARYAAAALAVAGLALVGCSTSTSGNSSGGGSSSPAAAAGSGVAATGQPIVIGNVGTYSGPIGSSNASVPTVLQKWVADTNANGGINGHPVHLVSADDQTSPSTALTEAETQVSNSHAVAFVANMQEATANALQQFVESRSIPVVGGDQNLPVWFQSPMYFSTSSGNTTLNKSLVELVKQGGFKKLSIWYCTDSPTCKVFGVQDQGFATSDGINQTGLVPMSLAQPNFAAQCLSAKQAGVDIVLPTADPSTFTRLVKNCQAVGYNPTYALGTNAVEGTYTSLAGRPAAISAQQIFPFYLTSGSPALAEYKTIVESLPADQLNVGTAQAWAAVQLFAAAAKIGVPKGGTPTSADILNGLYALKGTTLNGLTIPLSFVKGQPSPQGNCYFKMTLSGGKFSAPNFPQADCLSS